MSIHLLYMLYRRRIRKSALKLEWVQRGYVLSVCMMYVGGSFFVYFKLLEKFDLLLHIYDYVMKGIVLHNCQSPRRCKHCIKVSIRIPPFPLCRQWIVIDLNSTKQTILTKAFTCPNCRFAQFRCLFQPYSLTYLMQTSLKSRPRPFTGYEKSRCILFATNACWFDQSTSFITLCYFSQ